MALVLTVTAFLMFATGDDAGTRATGAVGVVLFGSGFVVVMRENSKVRG